jgi:hypothetical protein
MEKMTKTLKVPVADNDPALIDFLLENRIAKEILKIFDRLGPLKTDGWIKVPDVIHELMKTKEFSQTKSLRSAAHYFCKRLYEKYGALDRHTSVNPVYYRINDKGKVHLARLKGKSKGEIDERE